MLRKLATTLILVLTTSLALIASATARFVPEPPGPDVGSVSAAVASHPNASGFTGQGSPFAYIGTLFAGDPAARNAQPVALGGGGSYATAPSPGSNTHVPGLQP